ncbi:MAG: glycoside hydrolase family 2 TIM barrel-domain containing protein [Bacteroidales bacterium]|nr:glycoside hydrolase family 2 TIM barrel-domain containing protein [Bacteroidales bacterium]
MRHKKFRKLHLICGLIAFTLAGYAHAASTENFDKPTTLLQTVGRGNCRIEQGVFKSQDSYALFGDKNLKDYSFTFKARAPKNAEQVQIWTGFRAYNRNDRYVFGMSGGLQNNLYLSRMGYMGADEFLALRTLDFHPEPGVWYDFRIEVCDNRIRVFLNNETLPRMDLTDKNSDRTPSGPVTLGGGWIDTEFDDLTIEKMASGSLKDIAVREYSKKISLPGKENKRIQQRIAYQPIVVKSAGSSRTVVSLDGNWLFMPDDESNGQKDQASASMGDESWHVMSVPNFWNPIRIWLHGETMGPYPKGVSDAYYQKETDRCEGYTFDYKKTKAAWYRQWVILPEDVSSKMLQLSFDAVSKVAEVYINGQLAGSHIGMFGSFTVDGTKLFKPGKNLVAVKVIRDFVKNINNADQIVDVAVTVPVTNKMLKDIAHGFYGDDPAGIWQPVTLIMTDPLIVEDAFIKPTLTGANFEVTVRNHAAKDMRFDLATVIVDKETKSALYSGLSQKSIVLKAGEERVLSYGINDLKPRLWTPQHPNLYDFSFRLIQGEKEIDHLSICSGFRTFESKNGLLYLNGIPYWLRGGNHTPFALAPNDAVLANKFYQLMKAGNIEVTRTHTTPYNELWMNAADSNGIGISFEGTWPWLMIQSSMPDLKLIDMWKEEFLGLLKKYRNHPSLLLWTINNEMKFYDNEPDLEKAKLKMSIISDVVKEMRKIDPTRPICFDSNYKHKGKPEKFGKEFFKDIDDGDIDDIHAYINWYDHSLFKQFNGEFQRDNKTASRPLISQEMSTGYPNNETGHPTRAYTLIHQNPQTLVGYQAYAFGNPNYFLNTQSFITGELAEALRRSNDQGSGILHFALLTWFRNVYDAQKIEPYPTYYALKRALQPVLVSAELWGRHFYAGETIRPRVYVVNDLENGHSLASSVLNWSVVDQTGKILSSGKEIIPSVAHYTRKWITPDIQLPNHLALGKTKVRLVLKLTENGIPRSENEYELLLAEKSWCVATKASGKIVLVDFDKTSEKMDFLGYQYVSALSVKDAFMNKADLYVISGLKLNETQKNEDAKMIRDQIAKGAKVIILHSKELAKAVFPEYITGWIVPTEGDIVNMEVPESPVFDGIGLMDLRYFNNGIREMPVVCHAAYSVQRNVNVLELANQTKIHGYINGSMSERSDYVKTIKGFPLLQVSHNKGVAILSEMSTEKAMTDPVAGKLLTNMINELMR